MEEFGDDFILIHNAVDGPGLQGSGRIESLRTAGYVFAGNDVDPWWTGGGGLR